MRKPQCTVVHEDFRIERNAEITLFSHPSSVFLRKTKPILTPSARFRMSTGHSHEPLTTLVRGISHLPGAVPAGLVRALGFTLFPVFYKSVDKS